VSVLTNWPLPCTCMDIGPTRSDTPGVDAD
jgi:hypothetical protein